MKKIMTYSKDDTIKLGYKLSKLLKPGMIILLHGELGAGKTSFTKGIGLGLNVKDVINSPTFNILKVYEGDYSLNHIDAYRLEGIVQDLGFEDEIYGDGITVIEWPEFIEHMYKDAKYLYVNIEYIDEDTREFSFEYNDDIYKDIVEEL